MCVRVCARECVRGEDKPDLHMKNNDAFSLTGVTPYDEWAGPDAMGGSGEFLGAMRGI